MSDMSISHSVRFIITMLVALLVVFPIAAVFTPPDPFTQLRLAVILIVISLPVAYYLSFQGRYESLSQRLNR